MDKKNTPLKLKKLTKDGQFSGYASRFGEVDSYNDVIQKGAFSDNDFSKTKMLWQHDPGQPIGKWTSIKENSVGLKVEGQLSMSLRQAQEAYVMLKEGLIDGMSIGFRTLERTFNKEGVRVLTKLELWEVSLVTFPALASATVDNVKSADEAFAKLDALNRRLRGE